MSLNKNTQQIAIQNYKKLTTNIDSEKNFARIKYFDGVAPPLLKTASLDPRVQVTRILQTAPILADKVTPYRTSNTNTLIHSGSSFQQPYLGRIQKYTVSTIYMDGLGYTLNLPLILEPVITYVYKFVKQTDSDPNTEQYTIQTTGREKISYLNGTFTKAVFNSNSKKGDYLLLVNINIDRYNSQWLVVGFSEGSITFS